MAWGVTRAQREASRAQTAPEDAAKRPMQKRQKLQKTAAPKRFRSPNGTRKPTDPTEAWERHLRRVYRITAVEYARLLQEQEGVCAICGRAERYNGGRGRRDEANAMRLAVDHDHKSGKVRGLLCVMCNTAIGAFDDDPLLLAKAIVYLTERNVESEWKLPGQSA